jgi:iron complex outermembrane receptor protein
VGDVFEGETAATGVSGKVALEYAPAPNVNTYVSYARGYKGPAFNVFFNFNENHGAPIEPETSDAVEAGIKGALWQRRLYLSAVGFYHKFDNFQANNFVQLGGTLITTLTNAGQVSTRGVEVELTARPAGGLTLTGGVSYTDAHVDRFKSSPDGTPSRTRPGEDLPLSPDWKVALTGDYRLPLHALPIVLPFEMRLSSQVYWQSLQYSDFGELPELRIPSYGLWDAAMSFASRSSKVEVTLLVRNILDQSFATLVLPGAQGDSVRYLIPREASRYVGASVRVAL